jgi:tRNA-splicing ligase RtcB (3'-phosphate/5'-hydroxy nucleic acid ligase)
MIAATRKYGIELPDRQLCCAPLGSPEGTVPGGDGRRRQLAFANRQMMTHWARESLKRALGVSHAQAGIETLYDVCHNIAKFETFELDGQPRRLCVHRKGATRAYPPGHPQPRPRTGTWASR